MHGIDVNDELIRAAKLFSNSLGKTNSDFKKAQGEILPYPDESFDAIVSFDVLEHVSSVPKVLSESFRILKKGGMFFAVFPSFYMPTEAHLKSATSTPCIHWFFSPQAIMKAYDEIILSRGEKNYYWYYQRGEMGYEWATFHSGIGINGTTIANIREILKKSNFSKWDWTKNGLINTL